MVITIVVDQYGQLNNGTTMTTKRFAEILRDHGHEVRIVCALPSDDPYVYVMGAKHIPIFDNYVKKQGFVFSKVNKENLENAIIGSDIVHLMLPFKLERMAYKMAKKHGIAVTGAYHLPPECITYNIRMQKIKPINSWLYSRFRKLYNRLGHVHCPSRMVANQLLKHHYKSELHVISNGVNPAFVRKNVERPAEYKDKFIVLGVGRLSPEKRQDLIIKAVLLSKYEKNIQVILAGRGPWENTILQLASKLTNKMVLKFCSQDELIELINYSDIYVHASDAETEGISCIEAISCGLVPIIGDSKISAAGQFSIDDRCLFSHGNPQDLASKIDYFYENRNEIETLREKYIESAKQYQLESCVMELENVFEQAIAENKAMLDNKTKKR